MIAVGRMDSSMFSLSNPTISEASIAGPRAESSDELAAVVRTARGFTGTNSGKRAAMRVAILGVWGAGWVDHRDGS